MADDAGPRAAEPPPGRHRDLAPVRVVAHGDVLHVRLHGRLTAQVCEPLRAVLLDSSRAVPRVVVVDADAVLAVDDEVVSVLLAGAAWLSARGSSLRVAHLSASLARALDALGVAHLLPLQPTVPAVPAALGSLLPRPRTATEDLAVPR